MKRILFTIFALGALAAASFAQSADEKAITAIHLGLEKAYVQGDAAPFEAALADSYTFTGPDGKSQTRSEILKEMRDEIAKPTYKNISETSDNVKVRVLGNAAYVTAGWTSVTQGLGEGAAPHTDKGQYTGIYEKISGKWMLVREVFTEAQHDRKAMEQEVIAVSKTYDAIMKNRDKAAFERLLHKDYLYTTEEGVLVSRAEEMARFTSGDVTISTSETMDQNVRITGNTSAVETGKYHAIGTYKGKAFDETGRYTTTWVWRDGRWQIIADHNSLLKK
ncbi:hypothetical protein BH10ACI3_BH10ACI3_21330 [soil metagenome]